MAMALLGETLDIHTGGIDNLFPHHTNEIAQSEGATGVPFARYWLHAAHLLVEGQKMAKSLGNFLTIPDVIAKGHAPSAIRYLLLSGHYRTQLNFTFDGLKGAAKSVERLYEFRARVRRAAACERLVEDDLTTVALRARARFEVGMDDDLNVSEALAAVFGLVREVNQKLDEAAPAVPRGVGEVLSVLSDFEAVFGVLGLRSGETGFIDGETEAWAADMIAAREKARAERDFDRADEIRDALLARGIVLEDTAEGTRWKRRGTDAVTTSE